MKTTPVLCLALLVLTTGCRKYDDATRITDPENPPYVGDGPQDSVTATATATATASETATGTGTSTTQAAPGVFSLAVPAGKVPSRNVRVTWTSSSDAEDMIVSLGASAGCVSPSHSLTVSAAAGEATFFGVADGVHQACAKAVNAKGDTPATAEQAVTVGSVVVGQAAFDIDATGVYPATQSRIGSPSSALIIGGKLVVADKFFNRVLIWNQVPHADDVPADVVLGQADFTSNGANRGGPAAANTLNAPGALATDGTRLIVADGGNHRVLIWQTVPTESGANADLVLGQASMDGNAVLPTDASSMDLPFGIAVAGSTLLVTDYQWNRIQVWNSFPTVNNQAANVVIGQTLDSTSAFGTTDGTLRGPGALVVDVEGGVWVSDQGNHRVLRYSTIPTANGAAATLVLGQGDFTTAVAGTTPAALDSPWGIDAAGSKLIVSDSFNDRILVWNSWPTTKGQSADSVLGQADFTSNSQVTPPTVNSIHRPYEVKVIDGTLIVSDFGNGRVILRPFP